MLKNRSQTYVNLTGLCFLAFVFAVVYMVGHTREMISIISSYVQYNQRSYLNLSNFAYCLVGVCHAFLSVTLMYPHRDMFIKRNMIKCTCYLVSLMYLLGNLWVIEWLMECVALRTWSFDVAQFLKEKNMMFCHMQWITRNAEAIFYNHLAALAWFLMGYYFDRDRKMTCRMMLLQILVAFILPVGMYYLSYGKMTPDWWTKKTIPIICSDVLIAAGLFYVSPGRESWTKYVCPLKRSKHRHHHHHHHHHHGEDSKVSTEKND